MDTREPKGLYLAHIALDRNLKSGIVPDKVIIYCRVSFNSHKEDLMGQVEAMEQFCRAQGVSITEVVTEIGGGLNFKQPKFLHIIQQAIQGQIRLLYVAHKDRLCRFGFDEG